MPTLDAGSRLDNIDKSVYAHLRTNVITGLSATVYFMGAGRNESLASQWIEADVIHTSAVTLPRRAASNQHSVTQECLLNLNCFQVVDAANKGLANIYALMTLVDNVRQIYDVTASILVYDYNTSGNPLAGALRVYEKPSVIEVVTPPSAGIRQANISVPLRYQSVTTD